MVAVDPILPTDALDHAHTAIDNLIQAIDGKTADTVWLLILSTVANLPPEQQRQNLSLLLTVALQRLAVTNTPY